MSEEKTEQNQEMVLITIVQKNNRLEWRSGKGINAQAVEQILLSCLEAQKRINIKNDILMELNKPQIVKPIIADIGRVKH